MSISGLSEEEQEIMDLLVKARNKYQALPRQHLSEPCDFDNALHILQQLLAIRIVRRDYPNGWNNLEKIL